MSVQFGRWDFEGKPPDPDYMGKVSAFLAPYGPDGSNSPDGSGVYSESGIKILFCGFCTTNESHCEIQPHVSSSGAVIAWDGRLDNRGDLTSVLHEYLDTGCTDVEMVAAAYEAWGADCFARLIGDWALSIWNPADQSLILAKDPIGTRHLYYTIDSNKAEWCTLLDPLVLFGGKAFSICEEYVAGWFSTGFPAANLTPYSGIHAVAPSSNTKSTFAAPWPQLCSAGCGQIGRSSLSSAAAWTLRLLSAWRIPSSPEAPPKLDEWIPFPGTTILMTVSSSTQTNTHTSAKSKKSVVVLGSISTRRH